MKRPKFLIMFPTKTQAYTFYLDFFHNLIGDKLVEKEGYSKLVFENYDIMLCGEEYDNLRGMDFDTVYVSDFMQESVINKFIMPCVRYKRERINFV